jgi:hypothetical protein
MHNATVIMNGLTKFSQSKDASSTPPRSRIRMINERIRSRMEAKNPINPGPGAWKLPIPSFKLDVMINAENPIRKRLVTWFNRFIPASFYRDAILHPASTTGKRKFLSSKASSFFKIRICNPLQTVKEKMMDSTPPQ